MRRKRYRKVTTYFILYSLLLVVGVVYAALQANLEINGTTKITQNTWNIFFDNVQVTPGSVEIGTNNQAATITNSTTVAFSVDLSNLGDFYEFTVDVKNTGTIDGMISSISSKLNNTVITTLPAYLNYEVTYSDGAEIELNQLLKADSKETIKIRVEVLRDINMEDLPSEEQNLNFLFELDYAQADTNAINVIHLGQPVLTEGLIPVTIANDGTVTTVTEDDDTWFNYDNKIWANAVLVKESGVKTRAQNKVAGTVINQDDILAYFVWIPRYSYKIWTLDASQAHTGEEQTIDIKFVNTNINETASSVGDWYTHPAFTFGTEELPGFWVGKFETSTDTTSTCYTSPSSSNCNNENQSPRIVPNVDSLRYQYIRSEFATSLKFAGGTQSGSNVTFAGNSTYGLTSTADSHMMKNSEWGAVAYLSHSNYGINEEIRINNYRKDTTTYATLTGCGASTINASVATTCDITYGSTSSYPQSTTGNISGVFDMSGGAYEYVMGNYNSVAGSSGFSTLPASKYYDNYPSSTFTGDSSTNFTFCTLATCGGHVLNETRNWYNDYAYFVNSSGPWFLRGGYCNGGQDVGAFASHSNGGYSGAAYSWRGVLVAR